VITYDSDAPGCRDLFINQASTAQIGTSEVDVLASLGYLAAYAAVSFASRKITGSAGQTFTAGKLGKFTIGADNTVLGPPFVFAKSNISQFDF
jgi:hypothetical protein